MKTLSQNRHFLGIFLSVIWSLFLLLLLLPELALSVPAS